MPEANGNGKKVRMKEMLSIWVSADGEPYVKGPLAKTELCLSLLEDAKKIVKDFKPPLITRPNLHGILNFARRLKR